MTRFNIRLIDNGLILAAETVPCSDDPLAQRGMSRIEEYHATADSLGGRVAELAASMLDAPLAPRR